MTLAIAHRGDPLGAGENTIAGILRAVDLGADVVEVDIQVTADGAAVLHHDPELLRLWNHPAAVAELTLAQLHRHAPQVPTLLEALAALNESDAPLLLDVAAPAAALAAHQDLVLAGRRAAAAWFCGDPAALVALRARDARIPRMLSWDRPARPDEALLAATQPLYFNPCHLLLSRGLVRYWQERGVRVSTWTVDTPGRLEQLLEWGVDAIISNDISALVAAVRAAA